MVAFSGGKALVSHKVHETRNIAGIRVDFEDTGFFGDFGLPIGDAVDPVETGDFMVAVRAFAHVFGELNREEGGGIDEAFDHVIDGIYFFNDFV